MKTDEDMGRLKAQAVRSAHEPDGWRCINIAVALEDRPPLVRYDYDIKNQVHRPDMARLYSDLSEGEIIGFDGKPVALPVDARFVGDKNDITGNVHLYCFEHPSFPARWRLQPIPSLAWKRKPATMADCS